MIDSAQINSADFDSHTFKLTHLEHTFFSDEQFAQAKGEKYVVFCLGADFFAVSSDKVSEVVQMLSVTPLPNVPAWLLGIADLRGTIISVVSLRKLLDTPGAAAQPRTKFIVLKSRDFPSPVALAVDRLSEILVLPNEEIHFLKDEKTPYLLGRTMYQSNALTLLNVENLFSSLTI